MTDLTTWIENQHKEADRFMEQHEGNYMSKLTDNLDHWHEMGIYTGEDLSFYLDCVGFEDALAEASSKGFARYVMRKVKTREDLELAEKEHGHWFEG